MLGIPINPATLFLYPPLPPLSLSLSFYLSLPTSIPRRRAFLGSRLSRLFASREPVRASPVQRYFIRNAEARERRRTTFFFGFLAHGQWSRHIYALILIAYYLTIRIDMIFRICEDRRRDGKLFNNSYPIISSSSGEKISYIFDDLVV